MRSFLIDNHNQINISMRQTCLISKFIAPPIPEPDDLFVADMVKISEQRCIQLEQQIEKLKLEKGMMI